MQSQQQQLTEFFGKLFTGLAPVGQADDRAVDGDLKLILLVEIGSELDAANDARLHSSKPEVERVHETAAGR